MTDSYEDATLQENSAQVKKSDVSYNFDEVSIPIILKMNTGSSDEIKNSLNSLHSQ